MSERLTSDEVRTRKAARFPVITAYDAPLARAAEAAGIDVLLVGDSLGMVVLGYASTADVTLADMERHTAAVVRGSTRAHVIADLPFGTYEQSDADALHAARVLVAVGAGSVKLEGGTALAPRIRAIVDAGIPVCAHIGVLPQTAANTGGFRLKRDRDALLANAAAVRAAGAYAVVLEMVEDGIASEITAALDIPTIGIGSGPATDGQVLVVHDVLGLYPSSPPFAKRYADLASEAQTALAAYARDVRDGAFPVARSGASLVANPYARP